ncbi:HD domain-containing protein [bacterium]|nr:HD domain-containing protein [bacterium]
MNSPLIVDSDPEFLVALKMDPSFKKHQPVVVRSQTEAITALKGGGEFSGIFINPKLAAPHGIPLIQESILHQPIVPIFLLEGFTKTELTPEELKKLTVRGILKKPFGLSAIMQAILETQATFDAKTALQIAARNGDKVGQESHSSENDFVPILAKHFLAGTSSFFDIYVKIPPGRFLMILHAGDLFQKERIESYLSKGVTHLYLKKEAQESYLNYCQDLTARILGNNEVSTEIKVGQVSNLGNETAQFMRLSGLSESTVTRAQGFVTSVRDLSKHMDLDSNKNFSAFMNDLVSLEHATATTMIAGILGKFLGMSAEKSVQIVGMAGFFHDVGLQNMPEKFKLEDEKLLNDEEKKLYRSHPIVGAQIFMGVKGIDPAVIQAIEQHHERRTADGFPARLGAGAINRVAEIVGISELYVEAIKRHSTDKTYDPFKRMELGFNSFASPISDAFRRIFFPKK